MVRPAQRRPSRRQAGWLLAAAALAGGCSPPGPEPDSPARWIDPAGLGQAGFGSVVFEARDGNQLTALTYRATRFDPASGPVWFVLHGASRNASRYVQSAAAAAERNAALAIVIHFPKALYPSSQDYTLGLTARGPADGDAQAEGRWRAPDRYLYAEIEHVFDAVRQSLGGNQRGYYLFGHSAGAQFVHRLMTFLPRARTLGAVAANAGWYTLPADRPEAAFTMPYGLRGSPVREQDLGPFLAAPFTVLLGERDTSTAATDSLVRGTPEAAGQGASRLERGRYYYTLAEERARSLGLPFAWRLAVAPRAGHDAAQVMDSAAAILFAGSDSLCQPSRARDAAGLFLTEVLADPPAGASGDSNGDGARDPSADEFVEIINTGSTPVCLAGWALGDVANPERHVFPLGTELGPGGVLVVFGGGVPTGDFGRAATLTAAFDGRLSLSNAGDVLSLRDAADEVATRLSWGDCARGRCAEEHFPGGLDDERSITRTPGPGAAWALHGQLNGRPFSPGVRPDGVDW